MKRHFRRRLRTVKAARTPKRGNRIAASLAAAGLAACGAVAQADTATTLTGLPATNDNIPVGHGSNADVTLSWSEPDPAGDDWDQYAAWDGRGDVYQINDEMASISLAPTAANIKITMESFFLDEYAGGDDTSVMWSVTGSSSGVLASGTWVDKNTANDPTDVGGRTQISPMAMGIAGETLTVLFDQTNSGGYVSYLAMDNLTFLTTVIPEPSSAVLALGGLGALAMRRKRK
jgi:hypothetical protein